MLFVLLFALLFLPSLAQLILTYNRVKNKASLSVGWSFLLAFFLGLFTPVLAFVGASASISAGSNGESARLTGADTFLFIGYLVTFTLTPLIGIIGAFLSVNHPSAKNASGQKNLPF